MQKKDDRKFDFSEFKTSDSHKKYRSAAVYAFFALLAVAAFTLFIFNFFKITSFLSAILSTFSVIIYGALIACALFPFFRLFNKLLSLPLKSERHTRLREILSLVLTYVSLLFIVAVLLVAVLPSIGEEVTGFASALKSSISQARRFLKSNDSLSFLLTTFDNTAALLQKNLLNPALIMDYASTLLSGTYNIIFGIILSVYFLLFYKKLGAITSKILLCFFKEHTVSRTALFVRSIYTGFMEFIVARLILASILAAATYIFCLIIGIPYRAIIMLVLLITDFFPFFGPIVGAAIAFILVLLIDPPHAIFLLIFIIAVRLLESKFLTPRLLRPKLRPGIASTAFCVLIGYMLFGGIGALLAIPVYAAISLPLREFQVHHLLRKGYRIEDHNVIHHDAEDAQMTFMNQEETK